MAAASIDASGLIPTTQSAELISAAVEQSAVLTLGRRIPMPAGHVSVPVLTALPGAGFLGAGATKPFTDLKFSNPVLKAEEVGAVVAIPQSYLDDSGLNLWAAIQPELAAAIGHAVDDAVLFGTGAPASFPAGGVVAGLTPVAAGTDVVDQVNVAMSQVEATGLPVTGSAADLKVKGAFRGVRDTTGALLLGFGQADTGSFETLYGVPIEWTLLNHATIDFITGDWTKLIIGVRQDIRYEMSDSGTIYDPATKAVIISAFQDDQILMRVYMRLGVVLAKPVSSRGATQPFAVAAIAPAARSGQAAAATPTTDETGSTRQRRG
jgi:HK97 family phage major capsid protein